MSLRDYLTKLKSFRGIHARSLQQIQRIHINRHVVIGGRTVVGVALHALNECRVRTQNSDAMTKGQSRVISLP